MNTHLTDWIELGPFFLQSRSQKSLQIHVICKYLCVCIYQKIIKDVSRANSEHNFRRMHQRPTSLVTVHLTETILVQLQRCSGMCVFGRSGKIFPLLLESGSSWV